MASRPGLTSLSSVTSAFLLEGLKRADNRTIWNQFVDRYRPLIIRYTRRLGIDEATAEDITQQALLAFATCYQEGKYDRDRGRLRHWLFGIVRNQIKNWQRRGRPRELQMPENDDETRLIERIGVSDDESIWEQEWRDAVLRQCLEEIRSEVEPKTLQAFELFALQEWSAERVAESLGITANAVFGVKRRLLRRIRELMPQMEEAW